MCQSLTQELEYNKLCFLLPTMMDVQIKRTKGDSQFQKTHDTDPTVNFNKLFCNLLYSSGVRG